MSGTEDIPADVITPEYEPPLADFIPDSLFMPYPTNTIIKPVAPTMPTVVAGLRDASSLLDEADAGVLLLPLSLFC